MFMQSYEFKTMMVEKSVKISNCKTFTSSNYKTFDKYVRRILINWWQAFRANNLREKVG